MPNFTAGTSFTDGVTNDVTAAKLNALIADAVPTANLSLNSTTGTISNFTASTANITTGTIANFTASTANVTTGTITTLTSGTTTATAEIITSGTIGTLNSTTASISNTLTLNSVKVDAFPAGTVLLFYQSSAPTGWTQVTTQNNKALRVVSGTGGGTGGSTGFTSVFTSRTPSTPSGTISVSGTVGNTTLTYNQIPAHSHALYMSSSGNNNNLWHRVLDNYPPASGDGSIGCTAYEGQLGVLNAGGGGSHNHSWSGSASFSGSAMTEMDFAVQYIDIILASKNA